MRMGGLAGRGMRGLEQRITLRIGRGVDALAALVGRRPPGSRLVVGHGLTPHEKKTKEVQEAHVLEAVFEARAKQLKSRTRAGATMVPAQGIFGGIREASVVVDLLFFPSPSEPTFDVFLEAALSLGEELALALAQAEILFTITDGLRPAYTMVTSPLHFPSPDAPEWGAFIKSASRWPKRE